MAVEMDEGNTAGPSREGGNISGPSTYMHGHYVLLLDLFHGGEYEPGSWCIVVGGLRDRELGVAPPCQPQKLDP
jgi:hypothetical protein